MSCVRQSGEIVSIDADKSVSSMMATVSRSHVVDRSAETVLRSLLPRQWLVRKQDPDYMLDFEVEIVDETSGEPTGVTFFIQLKGTRRPKIVNGSLAWPLKTKHLAYWYDLVRRPVYLVVADVDKACAYWLFIQGYVKKARPNWRNHKKKTVHVPLENTFDTEEKFLTELEEADSILRDMWPGTIQAAAASQEKEYGQIDPRFSYNISYVDGTRKVTVNAKEAVEGTFTVRVTNDDKGTRKIADLFERGKLVTFDNSELSFEGLPIFEHVSGGSESVSLRVAKSFPCKVILYTSSGRPCVLDGEAHIGESEAQLEATLYNGLLRLHWTMERRNHQATKGRLNANADLTKWEKQNVLALPYLDVLYELFCGTEKNDIRMQVEVNGQYLDAKLGADDEDKFVVEVRDIFRIVWKWRSIVEAFNCSPELHLKTILLPENQASVDELFDLATKGKSARQIGEGATLEMECTNPSEEFEQLIPVAKVLDGPIRIENHDERVQVGEIAVPVGSVDLKLAKWLVKSVEKRKESKRRENRLMYVVLKATKDSTFQVSLSKKSTPHEAF